MIDLLRDNRLKFYGLLQIVGWGGYGVLNLLIMATMRFGRERETLINWTMISSVVLIIIAGIAVSHLFRMLIIKLNWLHLELKYLAPRLVFGAMVCGIAIVIIISLPFYFDSNLNFDFQQLSNSLPFLLMHWINLSIIMLLWSLIYFTIHYFENFQQAEIERFVWEAAVKDFELKTLKSQLNPHFMFNAMNGIRALIEEDPEKAKRSITQLSNIFRYSLNVERSETVPLEDEIKTVNDYLTLEQVRYEERLRFSVDIEPAVYFVEIPPMMVQTLVENGIKHGISKLPKGGSISVKAAKNGDNLIIKISNSGNLNEAEMNNSKGFGLANTKHRLSLLYGEKASFTIKNAEKMVEAVIKIPIGGRENESYHS